jgi:hypothetical protein
MKKYRKAYLGAEVTKASLPSNFAVLATSVDHGKASKVERSIVDHFEPFKSQIQAVSFFPVALETSAMLDSATTFYNS